MTYNPSGRQHAVRWYPPAYDIRVETVPVPVIEHPDDAIVKVKLAGLCGSDLHVYRGHEDVNSDLTCGHEFIGEVVALGSSFHVGASGRPELYALLRLGDKVVSPFTVSCGECHFCRSGFTCRCVHSCLFGIPSLPGGQAQFVRVPKAGGTLFKVDSIVPNISGVFAALQALQHPKIAPAITGVPYPFSSYVPGVGNTEDQDTLRQGDRILTIAVVGLGPVGLCATVSLLDMLAALNESNGVEYRVVAVDMVSSRRDKMEAIFSAMKPANNGSGTFRVADISNVKSIVDDWTNGVGCNAVLEVVGNNSALRLAYELVRPFGSISSVGVHQDPPVPFIGRELYDRNVSFDFGRCPVRAMLPLASRILLKYQDIFGGVGEKRSLIDRIVGFNRAVESYELFDKGQTGKILFDPWV